ncbi:MAG: IS1 family transposase [Methylococcales bacterium]|nr:IS1 family transposase [Methylococcales bacterium]
MPKRRHAADPKLTELTANGGLEAAFAVGMDEQWSYVGNKSNQRWRWHAVDHATNTVLAYVFGRRKDDVFKQLKTLLAPFTSTQMIGELINVTLRLINMKLISAIHKKSNVKI